MFLILLRICPMLPVMAHDVLLRPRLVAEMLAVSKSTVYRWFWEGRLQGVKLQAGTIRISASSVQEMLARAADSA
jgi:excisionase family DNA binding protein